MVARAQGSQGSAAKAGQVSAEQDFSGTTVVREAHRFDESKLALWLEQYVAGYEGPLRVEQFNGGQSNPTYKLVTPRHTYVLRRKPPGQILKGAHAVEREAEVLQALERADFPVAHVHALCTDDAVIGSWFYVMDFVAGRIIWDIALPQMSREDRPRYFDAMNATLARLHTIDYQAFGLARYGKPGNYFERQISRWSRQYLEDPQAGRDEHMDRLLEWLPVHIPSGDETTLVHGDFRIDNMIFHPTESRVLAVLDWELSTLGHPLGDFCYHLMMYRMPPLLIAGLLGSDLNALNIPSEAEYIAAYCQRTGRSSIEHLDFYMAFNMFRLAAIFHGIKGRLVRGTAASTHAQKMASSLPEVARLAWQQTRSRETR
jgi:aminoglycoside phosphotransferase (APT) family kinase protein